MGDRRRESQEDEEEMQEAKKVNMLGLWKSKESPLPIPAHISSQNAHRNYKLDERLCDEIRKSLFESTKTLSSTRLEMNR